MNRKLVGALLAVLGVALIGLAFVLAFELASQSCPSYSGNGTVVPTPVPCPAYSWTTIPVATVVAGVVLVASGGGVGLYHRRA